MPDLRFTAQSPLAAGTQLTTANAALPDQPNQVTPPAGGATVTFVASGTGPGTKALKVLNIASTVQTWGFQGFPTDPTNPNKMTIRGLVLFESVPAADTSWLRISSSGGGTNIVDVLFTSIGLSKIVCLIGAANTVTAPNTGTNILVAGTWYDFEVRFENATTVTGTMTLIIRDLAGTILTNITTGSTQDNGTTVPATVKIGKISTAVSFLNTQHKYITIRSGASSGLGQPGTNTAPSVPAIPNKVQSGSSSTSFTATPTDPEGDPLTHTWVVLKPDGSTLSSGITGASTATVTIANQTTPGAYSVTDTVSDGILSTVVTTYLLVSPPGGTPVQAYKVQSNGGAYSYAGDATSLVVGVNDLDGSGFIISGDNPIGASIIYNMPSPGPGHHKVSFFINWVDAALVGQAGVTGSFTGQVFQGTTALTAQKIFTNTTGVPTLVSFDFTSGEDTGLDTDQTDVRIELTATQ